MSQTSQNTNRSQSSLIWAMGLFVLIGGGAFILFPPGYTYLTSEILERPFKTISSDGVFEASLTARLVHDGGSSRPNSRVKLYENGKEMGPSHISAKDIAKKGGGAYMHQSQAVVFSTSDGSDPNTNNKKYWIEYPKPIPAGVYILSALILLVLGLYIADYFQKKISSSADGIAKHFGRYTNILLVALFFEMIFWSLTEVRLVKSGIVTERLYDHVFHGTKMDMPVLNYSRHHYMNYVLNPLKLKDGVPQHNREFYIRRAEPIRPRDKIHSRILVMGGSTTYDTAIMDEEFTWVGQLERLTRKSYGSDYDVINAGVGGYTLYENLIHYITTLTYLEPDVIVFYVGINDVHPRLFGAISRDYSNYRKPWDSSEELLPPVPKLISSSHIYRYFYLRHHIRNATGRSIGKLTAKPYPKSDSWEASLQKNNSEQYRAVLENFILLAKGQGRRVVILPQFYMSRKTKEEVFGVGVLENNKVNYELASKHDVIFGGSIISEQLFEKNDLKDAVHFVESGAKKMAHAVFKILENEKILSK